MPGLGHDQTNIREKLGITDLPEPLPHPDDLVINARTGKVTIRGPMIETEKDWWLVADMLKTEYQNTIAAKERKLTRHPDHPENMILLGDIEDAKRDLARLDEVFRDDVIARVVQSRTNAHGEVEFVDPQSMMKLVEK